jgi:hypothetical protein
MRFMGRILALAASVLRLHKEDREEGPWEEHGVGWKREVTVARTLLGFTVSLDTFSEVRERMEWNGRGWVHRVATRTPDSLDLEYPPTYDGDSLRWCELPPEQPKTENEND